MFRLYIRLWDRKSFVPRDEMDCKGTCSNSWIIQITASVFYEMHNNIIIIHQQYIYHEIVHLV